MSITTESMRPRPELLSLDDLIKKKDPKKESGSNNNFSGTRGKGTTRGRRGRGRMRGRGMGRRLTNLKRKRGNEQNFQNKNVNTRPQKKRKLDHIQKSGSYTKKPLISNNRKTRKPNNNIVDVDPSNLKISFENDSVTEVDRNSTRRGRAGVPRRRGMADMSRKSSVKPPPPLERKIPRYTRENMKKQDQRIRQAPIRRRNFNEPLRKREESPRLRGRIIRRRANEQTQERRNVNNTRKVQPRPERRKVYFSPKKANTTSRNSTSTRGRSQRGRRNFVGGRRTVIYE